MVWMGTMVENKGFKTLIIMNLLGTSAAFFDQHFDNPSLFRPFAERFSVNLLMRETDHLFVLRSIVQEAWEVTYEKFQNVDDTLNAMGVRGSRNRELIRKYGPGEIFETWIYQFLVPSYRPETDVVPHYVKEGHTDAVFLGREMGLKTHIGQTVSDRVVKFYYATSWSRCRKVSGSLMMSLDDAVQMCLEKISPLYNGQCVICEYTLDKDVWQNELNKEGHCYLFPNTEEGNTLWNNFNEYLKGYFYNEDLQKISSHPLICSPHGEIILTQPSKTIFHSLPSVKYFFEDVGEDLVD
jgi:hypothetical protein